MHEEQMSAAELQMYNAGETQERRARAKSSLLWYTMQTMDTYDPGWHHIETCRKLMRWIKGDTPFLILQQPPRHGKSELGSIRVPAFIYGQNPDARIIAGTYSADLAAKNNRSIQRVIGSEEHKAIFPGVTLNFTGARRGSNDAVRNSQEFEIVGHRGTYRCAGVGGGVTGFGADFIIIDDPIKNDEEADSEVYREKVWNWWQSTMFTRLEEHSRVLLIMTRWHEDDLAGRLLAQSKADPTAIQWEEAKFEAIREDMTDLNDERDFGDALWPEKYSIQRLTQIKHSLSPRWWNALYQQRPTALEGGIVKKAWIQYYKKLPDKIDKWVISVDASFKEKNTSDYVVIQVWAKAGRFCYLVDQARQRMGFVKTCDELKSMITKWPRALRRIIELKANGDAIMDSLKNEKIMGMVGYNPKSSKAARLESVSTFFRAGDILLPHPEIAPWVQVTEDEIVKFPNAKHDDTVDAATQALIDLIGVNDDWLTSLTKM